MKLSGKRPKNPGVREGRLAPCPNKPNCVSSLSGAGEGSSIEDNPQHVHPFRFVGDPLAVIPRLRQIVESWPRATVVTADERYLHAEFESRLLGFVDDVEFYVMPDEGTIHVRSAARLGYSDFGVNRARIEELRERFES